MGNTGAYSPLDPSKGSMRMETVRAFTEDEYRKLILSIP